MHIELATSTDISEISEVLRTLDTSNYRFSAPEVIANSISARMCWIARVAGQTTGTLIAHEVEGSFEIIALAVAPDYQRKGIGRQLLRAAEIAASERKFPKIWCWSLAQYSSQDFYKSCGFTEAVLLKRQFYGEDCWFFGKIIVGV
jgi:N-acetylglutamate synthase-like GNAT family acetyltransferase